LPDPPPHHAPLLQPALFQYCHPASLRLEHFSGSGAYTDESQKFVVWNPMLIRTGPEHVNGSNWNLTHCIICASYLACNSPNQQLWQFWSFVGSALQGSSGQSLETLGCTQNWVKDYWYPKFLVLCGESPKETFPAEQKDPLGLHHANHHVFSI
jgi:hypothetical protein